MKKLTMGHRRLIWSAHDEVLEYSKACMNFIAPQLHVCVCKWVRECMGVDIDVIFVNDGVHNF